MRWGPTFSRGFFVPGNLLYQPHQHVDFLTDERRHPHPRVDPRHLKGFVLSGRIIFPLWARPRGGPFGHSPTRDTRMTAITELPLTEAAHPTF